jgi:predicted site-specific integrase-resolvase
VNSSAQFLNPSEAARRLGVFAKALRLYEARGLIAPVRTAAGWRAYGPDEMARVAAAAVNSNRWLVAKAACAARPPLLNRCLNGRRARLKVRSRPAWACALAAKTWP